MPAKRKPLPKRDLVQALREQLRNCAGFDGDIIAAQREEALDYYFQRPRGDEVTGRSRVVSGDVSAMVEANLAQMLDAFSSDHLIEFVPDGPEDENQAQLESDTVTDFLMGRQAQPGYLHFAAAIKDALLLRNGMMKVWAEEYTDTRIENYQGVTPEAKAELENRPGIDCETLAWDARSGALQLRCIYRGRRLHAEAIPVENFFYLQDWPTLDLQQIPFCAERHVDTRSRCKELGFPPEMVDRIPRYHERSDVIAGAARNPRKSLTNQRAVDAAGELVEWYECFVLIDRDGDGIAERRRICLGGEAEILADDPVNLVPFAAGVALLNPHRFLGISLFDKLKQVQDLNTGLQRALMDNVNTTTKNRVAYLDGRVNPEDLSDGRPNGEIRIKGVADVRTAVMPFAVPDTSLSILENIQFQKSIRTEMGGASLELASGQLQVGDRVGSQGIDRAYSVMEQLAAMMTRITAMTLIRSTALLAHATLREHFTGPVHIKRNGKWESPNPSQWPERRRVMVKPGMSPGERQRRAGAQWQLLETQIKIAELGMDEVLVDVDGFYRLLMDWARTMEVQNPEQYFLDPETPRSKEAAQAKKAAAQQQDEEKRALMSQAIGLEQIRAALDKYQHDTKLQFQYFAELLGAEVEEAKITGAATVDYLKAKRAARESEKAG